VLAPIGATWFERFKPGRQSVFFSLKETSPLNLTHAGAVERRVTGIGRGERVKFGFSKISYREARNRGGRARMSAKIAPAVVDLISISEVWLERRDCLCLFPRRYPSRQCEEAVPLNEVYSFCAGYFLQGSELQPLINLHSLAAKGRGHPPGPFLYLISWSFLDLFSMEKRLEAQRRNGITLKPLLASAVLSQKKGPEKGGSGTALLILPPSPLSATAKSWKKQA